MKAYLSILRQQMIGQMQYRAGLRYCSCRVAAGRAPGADFVAGVFVT